VYSGFGSGFHHPGVKNGSPHAERVSLRKTGRHGNACAHEANPAERLRAGIVKCDTQLAQGGQSVGHQSFAARFVDWRVPTISDGYIKPFSARGKRSR